MGNRQKIGDVFSIKVEGKHKHYVQYVADDRSYNSLQVIRIFRKGFPIDHVFNYWEVFDEGIDFYVHVCIRREIELGILEKVGSAPVLDFIPEQIFFVTGTVRYFTEDSNLYHDPIKWTLWSLDGPTENFDVLPSNLIDKVELCTSLVTGGIEERIIRGYYTQSIPEYDILKRRPHSSFHSYLRKYEQLGSQIHHWHFEGECLIQEIICCKDNTIIFSKDYALDNSSLDSGIRFWEINWEERDFISEEEFEGVWNQFNSK